MGIVTGDATEAAAALAEASRGDDADRLEPGEHGIVGPDLVTVESDGKTMPLFTWLAARLAARLKLDAPPEQLATLNQVAAGYLDRDRDRELERVYSSLKAVMPTDADLAVPEALANLARITPLKLFVSTTFDNLLERAINAERFGGDPRTLGLFTTAVGVGGLASAAFSGPVRHVSRQGRAMLAAVAVWGAAFAGFAVAPGLWLTLGLLAVAGAADTFTVVFRGTIVTAQTPGQLLGRVMAADYVIGAGGGQLGNLEAGALGSLTSPAISAVTGGLVTIAGAVVIALAMPAFMRYRHPHHQTVPSGAQAATPQA